MPRVTKAMLLEENAKLKADLDEIRSGYWKIIEDLQRLGQDFGCQPGENRLTWLRAKLEEASCR